MSLLAARLKWTMFFQRMGAGLAPASLGHCSGIRPMSTKTPVVDQAQTPSKPEKTFSKQSSLPRLPVPDLQQSLEGYLKSLKPILEQKYGSSSLANEMDKRKLFAKDFASKDGLGRILQNRLLDLDHTSPHNWLDDTLWLGLAYHTWRAPLLINSNWWLLFKPDPRDSPAPSTSGDSIIQPNPAPSEDAPKGSQGGGRDWVKDNQHAFSKPESYDNLVKVKDFTPWQIRRAAWLIRRHAEYRTTINREEIPPEINKANQYCMSQYQKVFNLSRIPLAKSDAFSNSAPHALHLTVLVDDFYYSIDVFSPSTGSDSTPEPLPARQIEERLAAVVRDVRQRRDKGERPNRVGVLTGDERDTWTNNRERLLQLSPQNPKTLDSISSSLMVLSLDPYTLPSIPTKDPLHMASVDSHVRNSASGIKGGQNRWYDKAMSINIETSGRTGFCGEHSPAEALVPTLLHDYVLKEPVDVSAFDGRGGGDGEGGWERLEWVVDEGLQREIEECRGRNKALIEDSDASQLWWQEYGVEWIKKNAKMSPDAYIQQALQLAWYMDQGYASATYETASTRSMLHGRTDVIRTLTSESRAFVKAMLDTNSDDKTRLDLLHKACTTHTALTRASSAGQGYDRHLMGLKTRLQPGESHPLFDDEMYSKSQEWKFSTSGLQAGSRFMGTGFGAAWPDGYGINYLAGSHLIKFGVESKWSCGVTSTGRFKHYIVQAFRDLRRVCESA